MTTKTGTRTGGRYKPTTTIRRRLLQMGENGHGFPGKYAQVHRDPSLANARVSDGRRAKVVGDRFEYFTGRFNGEQTTCARGGQK